jgi:hypothetical protein
MSEIFLNFLTPELSQSGRSRLVAQNRIYHEEAFRYLLKAEAKRSHRSGQGYHILLVYRADTHRLITPMHSYVSGIVLDALAAGLRETDYIGWYREGHIVGGVLTVVEQDSIPDVFRRVHQRFKEVLLARLGTEESSCFHFRLCQQHELQDLESEMLTMMTVQ